MSCTVGEVMLLKQMPEAEDRCLISYLVPDEIDSCKAAYGVHFNQRIIHGWIAEAVALLHQVNPENWSKWIGRTAYVNAGLWVVRLNQIDQCLPKHDLIHFGQELLTISTLFCGALLVIG